MTIKLKVRMDGETEEAPPTRKERVKEIRKALVTFVGWIDGTREA